MLTSTKHGVLALLSKCNPLGCIPLRQHEPSVFLECSSESPVTLLRHTQKNVILVVFFFFIYSASVYIVLILLKQLLISSSSVNIMWQGETFSQHKAQGESDLLSLSFICGKCIFILLCCLLFRIVFYFVYVNTD